MVWKLLFNLFIGHNQIMQSKLSQDIIPNPPNNFVGIHKHPYIGYDERYVHFYGNSTKYGDKTNVSMNSELIQIARFMEILNKINQFENKKSEFQHPQLLQKKMSDEDHQFEDCSIHCFRMKNGGLMTDW